MLVLRPRLGAFCQILLNHWSKKNLLTRYYWVFLFFKQIHSIVLSPFVLYKWTLLSWYKLPWLSGDNSFDRSVQYWPKEKQHSSTFYVPYKMRYVSFLLVHIHVTVQNQLQLRPCQKHYTSTAFTPPALSQGKQETTWRHRTYNSSDQFISQRGRNKQQKCWILITSGERTGSAWP